MGSGLKIPHLLVLFLVTTSLLPNTQEGEPKGIIVDFSPDSYLKGYDETIILTLKIKNKGANGTLWYIIDLISDSNFTTIRQEQGLLFAENQTETYTIDFIMVYTNDITILATTGHNSQQDNYRVIEIRYKSDTSGTSGGNEGLTILLNNFIIFCSAGMVILIFVDFLVKRLRH